MNDAKIKATILTYGEIIERTEKLLSSIDGQLERLTDEYGKVLRLHEDAAATIEHLAGELENRRQAEAVLSLIRTGTTKS